MFYSNFGDTEIENISEEKLADCLLSKENPIDKSFSIYERLTHILNFSEKIVLLSIRQGTTFRYLPTDWADIHHRDPTGT